VSGSLKKTLVLKVDPEAPDPKLIRYAAGVLKGGGLVAFPTETVYGLGANLQDKEAVKRLYAVKGRPEGKPFTVHIADADQVKALGCSLDARSGKLAGRFWPGPLTMVLGSRDGGGVGFRMPANKVALELIRSSGVPVVAPSANLSGKKPPADAMAVMKDLDGKIEVVVDSGPVDLGVESTVIDMTVRPFKVLRKGAIAEEDLKKALPDG
jgi:L-threonylcarbamoyladenylate synthase